MTNERQDPAPTEGRPDATAEPDTVESLRAQLDEERNRAQGYYKSWQRAAADFQNFKRRTEEERQKNTLYANLALILNILPVYDDLDRALASLDGQPAGPQWVDGIRQIARKFQGALEAGGVKEIPAEGQEFDPNLHEAISQAPGPAGRVIQVVQKGYTLGDRVIRPAMVIVGNGAQGGSSEGNNQERHEA